MLVTMDAVGSYTNIPQEDGVECILELIQKYLEKGSLKMELFLRFLDDIFQIFVGTSKQLHTFFEEINQIHPTLKFTMCHTSVLTEPEQNRCTCNRTESIAFLDTSCSIKNGKIEIDLFRKETDRNQYLLTSSCHPIGCTKNIPYSLGLRIVRICTNPVTRDARLKELKDLLLERN